MNISIKPIDKEPFFLKRLEEIRKMFEKYKNGNDIDIIFRDNSAEDVCNVYFEYLDFFRDYLERDANVNIYKIVSGTELAIVKTQPIQHEDEDTQLNLNAQLAFYVGYMILFSWREYTNENKDQILFSDLYEFSVEHLTWLELLNPQVQYPYLSNAQTWRLLDLLLKEMG